jgi:S1-C subfamily serine protease
MTTSRSSGVLRLAANLVALATLSLPARAGAPSGATAADKDLAAAIRRVVPAYVFVGGGSGVAISPDGYVLTNDHVAGRAKIWKVRQPGGKVYVADLVGTDPIGDVALLKMRGVTNVSHVPLGDSDSVHVGQTVIAIGNPFMLGMSDDAPTVTTGVVSATNRFQGNYSDAIQTDAPINPGNSGGPLLTLDGKLVGINGRISTRFGTRSNTGIGYAISINQIKRFLPALKAAKGGRVHHGTIRGLVLRPFNPNLGGEDKAIVGRVTAGSTADSAGFLPGDRILSVENYPIVNYARFAGVLGTYPSGATVNVQVQRAGEKVDLAVKLDVRPIPGPVDFGWTFEKTNAQSIKENGGIKLKTVRAGGPADKAGLKAGDVIVEFNGLKLNDARNVVVLMRTGFEPGMKVKGKVWRRMADAAGQEVEREVEFAIVPARGRRADWGFQARYSQAEGGVLVLRVKPGGPAAKAGIRPGDVLVEVNGKNLRSALNAVRALRGIKPGQVVKGKLKRKVREGDTVVEKVVPFTLRVGVTR